MRLHQHGRIYGEVLTLAVGQGLSVAGALFGIRLLTSVLPPEVYGQVALAMTITALIMSTAAGPVSNAVGRMYAHALERRRLGALWGATGRFFAEAHCWVIVLGAGALVWVAHSTERVWMPIGILILANSLLGGANAVLDCVQNAARQRVVVAWHQACGQWLRSILAILAVHLWGASTVNVLCGYLVATALVLGSQITLWRSMLSRLTAFRGNFDRQESRTFTAEMRQYGLPFAIWAPIAWLQQSSDRWVLATRTNVSQVGVYQILFQLGFYPMTLLSTLISQVMGPVLFGLVGNGQEHPKLEPVRRQVRRLGTYMFAGTLAMSIIAWLIHGVLFTLLVPLEYRAVSYLLPLVVLASGLFATGQVLTLDALIQMSTRVLLAPKIVSAILAAGFNLVGATVAGLPGVVYATVLSSGVYAAWIFALTLRPISSGVKPVEYAELVH